MSANLKLLLTVFLFFLFVAIIQVITNNILLSLMASVSSYALINVCDVIIILASRKFLGVERALGLFDILYIPFTPFKIKLGQAINILLGSMTVLIVYTHCVIVPIDLNNIQTSQDLYTQAVKQAVQDCVSPVSILDMDDKATLANCVDEQMKTFLDDGDETQSIDVKRMLESIMNYPGGHRMFNYSITDTYFVSYQETNPINGKEVYAYISVPFVMSTLLLLLISSGLWAIFIPHEILLADEGTDGRAHFAVDPSHPMRRNNRNERSDRSFPTWPFS